MLIDMLMNKDSSHIISYHRKICYLQPFGVAHPEASVLSFHFSYPCFQVFKVREFLIALCCFQIIRVYDLLIAMCCFEMLRFHDFLIVISFFVVLRVQNLLRLESYDFHAQGPRLLTAMCCFRMPGSTIFVNGNVVFEGSGSAIC